MNCSTAVRASLPRFLCLGPFGRPRVGGPQRRKTGTPVGQWVLPSYRLYGAPVHLESTGRDQRRSLALETATWWSDLDISVSANSAGINSQVVRVDRPAPFRVRTSPLGAPTLRMDCCNPRGTCCQAPRSVDRRA